MHVLGGLIIGFCLSNLMNSHYLFHVELETTRQQQQEERKKEFQQQAHPLPSERTKHRFSSSSTTTTFEGDHHDGRETSQKSSRATSSTSTGACSIIGPSASALSIWHQHLDKIFNASHHRDDEQFIWHDFTARLLHFVTPRLQHSVQTLPTDWDKVGTILDILYERVQYLAVAEEEKKVELLGKDNDNDHDKKKNRHEAHEPRPLRILIMGGSVTVGINCANQVGFPAIFLFIYLSFIMDLGVLLIPFSLAHRHFTARRKYRA